MKPAFSPRIALKFLPTKEIHFSTIQLIPEYILFPPKNKKELVPRMELFMLLNNIVFTFTTNTWPGDSSFLKYSGFISMKGLNGSSLQIDHINLTQFQKISKPLIWFENFFLKNLKVTFPLLYIWDERFHLF